MPLFSWFIGNQKAKRTTNKNSQLQITQSAFNQSTMWPIAKVRRNTLVKQQEYTQSSKNKSANAQPQLKEKES
ncbi:hypothetical protein [Thalassotalea sp. G2M2-11]|uniref:hypothetical protein n=1 Tax=Thalassotalea sp. G2M2-11 TaxID=2787627 RepID=UPI0019D21BD2|nr:hypothetical protein [Thalassotalea sp. G2M2-11]